MINLERDAMKDFGTKEDAMRKRGSSLALDNPGGLPATGDEFTIGWKNTHLEETETYVNECKGVVVAAPFLNSSSPAMTGGVHEFHDKPEPEEKCSFSGCRFAELGGYLSKALQNLTWERSSKTLSTDKDFLFPIPLGVWKEFPPEQRPWLRAMIQGLNSMYGVSSTSQDSPNEAQKKVVSSLRLALSQLWERGETVPQSSFHDLFQVKGVDYRGEEVKLAKSFNWASISGAFPSEVGTLHLEAFCTDTCRFYVEDFERFLVPTEQQSLGRTPRVMVASEDWFGVAQGLIANGICGVLPRRLLYHVGSQPLLNGLFSVSKNEYKDGIELHRLIMNLVPLNRLCHSVKGDVCTLPSVTGLSAFYIEEGELALLSSEDIRCFYYLFRVPQNWTRFMGFAREIPAELVPPKWAGEPCHLVSLVLPMGWSNSVGLAQHIHRNVVRWNLEETNGIGGEAELRRDRPSTISRTMFRVYLDNWDEIRRVDRHLATEVEGKPSAHQLALRQQYEAWGLPRHPKKAVETALEAEIQGAHLNGSTGVAFAKPDKILKYMGLAWELVHRDRCTQRELQVIAGGLVYISMFRRALLGSLNAIWHHIQELSKDPPVVRRPLPREVKREIIRFLCMTPLAQMSFRLPMVEQVTASDASTTGGGLSSSIGLTSYGVMASTALVRGDRKEPFDFIQILTIGLFDGISALRVAVDILELPVAGHVSVECNPAAQRVVESAFPGSICISHVQDVTSEEVQRWACEYTSVGVILIGAGPPCQDVSKLNADRAGSQKSLRSSLYKEVPRVEALCKQHFPRAQVHTLVESVASMDEVDRAAMTRDLGVTPMRVDAAGVSLARRPRLFWCSWGLVEEPGVSIRTLLPANPDAQYHDVQLAANIEEKEFVTPGWSLSPGCKLATFTTSRPSAKPGRKPAGLAQCDAASLERWRQDNHRYPPYQYKPEFCLHHSNGDVRVASISEREVILGFPLDHTQHCLPKGQRVGHAYDDLRKTLLGNSWSVPVVAILLKSLFQLLGLMEPISVQELVDRLTPGKAGTLQAILQRPPLRRLGGEPKPSVALASRMAGLVSVKGEDLMIQSASEPLLRHQRFRHTVPSKAWKWKEVCGWQWHGEPEHINQLEMRAVMTSVKYWISKQRRFNCRVLHLVDSMVVLHALTRGRSSSRKLRRTIMRIQAYLLAANIHVVWAYVHTSQNPADRPSRRVKQTKWVKVKSI